MQVHETINGKFKAFISKSLADMGKERKPSQRHFLIRLDLETRKPDRSILGFTWWFKTRNGVVMVGEDSKGTRIKLGIQY